MANSHRWESLVGKRFGKLVALKPALLPNGKSGYECQCDCGKIVVVRGDTLKKYTRVCPDCGNRDGTGRGGPLRDLTGRVFDKLTVLHRVRIEGVAAIRYLCRCACGNERDFQGSQLRAGGATNCGCAPKPVGRKKTHGLTNTRLMRIWYGMIARCENPKAAGYANYGGRGIKVCDRWRNDLRTFAEDMGIPAPHESIERLNNNGNYEKDNCKWATNDEQHANRRDNVRLTYNGKTMNVTEWARELGVKREGIYSRVRMGWTTEEIFTRPFDRAKRRQPCQPPA